MKKSNKKKSALLPSTKLKDFDTSLLSLIMVKMKGWYFLLKLLFFTSFLDYAPIWIL